MNRNLFVSQSFQHVDLLTHPLASTGHRLNLEFVHFTLPRTFDPDSTFPLQRVRSLVRRLSLNSRTNRSSPRNHHSLPAEQDKTRDNIFKCEAIIPRS